MALSSRPAQSLLAYLALNAGIAHRREKLACLLWPEADDDNARSYLRHALWRTRKAVESDRQSLTPYILADELSVAFNPRSAFCLDVTTLERAVANTASADELMASMALYRGELLPGFVDEWVGPERDRIESTFQRGMQRLTEQLSAEQRWHDLVEVAERWITLGHSAEAGFRALMLAHAQLGDRLRVAATYDRCRRALFEELGVQPSAQTRALYEELATDTIGRVLEPSEPVVKGHPAAPAPAPGVAPYQGLAAFDESDADLFFGRELAVARLLGRVSNEHLLAVVGASGSGKSSVVRAGLVPAWRERVASTDAAAHPAAVFVLTPTARPLEALATCLTCDESSISVTARLVEELERGPRGLRLHLRRKLHPGARALLVVDQFEELFSLCHDAFEREAFVDNLVAVTGAATDVVVALRADFYASCAQFPALRNVLAEHQEYLGGMSADELRRAIEGPARAAGWDLQDGLVDLLLRDVGDEPGGLPLLSHALLETWRRREDRTLTLSGYAASGGVQGAIARTAETVYDEQLSPEQQVVARRVFIQLTEVGEGMQDTRRRVRIDGLAQRPADHASLHSVLNALADARLITVGRDSVEVAHEALIREWPRLRSWLDEDRAWLSYHRQLAEAAADWQRLGHDADATTGRELLRLKVDDGQLQGIAFSPDGKRLAASNSAGVIRLWDAATGAELVHIPARSRGLYRVTFSPDGRTVATGDYDGEVRIWDATSGDEVAELSADTHDAYDVKYSPDGTRLATSGNDGWARVWDVASRQEVLAIRGTPKTQIAGPWQVAFSPDGSQLAVVDYRESYVWDIASGRELRRFTGHTNDVLAVAFSPDGKRLATAGLDRRVIIWDVQTGRQLFALAGHTGIIYSLAFAPDGNRLISGSTDGTVRLWDMGLARDWLAFDIPPVSSGRVTFSTDGQRVASALSDGNTRVWDAWSGERVMSLPASDVAYAETIAASPDGNRFATSGREGLVRLWDSHSGELLRSFSASDSRVLGLAFAPDSQRLATGSGNLVQIWDVVSAETPPRVMAGHTNAVLDVAFSPDGRWVLSGSIDRTARLWDANTGAEVRQFKGHTDNVWGVRFSPDGIRMATASRDGTARVWEVASGHSLLQLTGHTSTVVSAAFSPDGKRIASASRDGTAKLWDAFTGTELLTLHGGDGGLNGVAFSPDGTRLATGGDLGVRVYVLPIDELVRLARSRLTRTWTLDECQRFLRTDACPALEP